MNYITCTGKITRKHTRGQCTYCLVKSWTVKVLMPQAIGGQYQEVQEKDSD